MNTNNKHPHFSRMVLHNGEERVKRIFRDQLAELEMCIRDRGRGWSFYIRLLA